MVNCTNDTRSRAIIECCNTSSCNNYTQPLLEAPPQNIIQTRKTISSTSKTTPSSTTTTSSTRLNLVSTTQLSHSTSRTSIQSPNIQTPTPIITNSGKLGLRRVFTCITLCITDLLCIHITLHYSYM